MNAPLSIWMRPERHGRGPEPAYSRERITAAAIAIADTEGIEAISMRRVAREVGAGAMSLYRYVGAKDELFELMIDAADAEDPLPDKPTGEWRAELRRVAERSRAIIRRHPWLAMLTVARPTFGPNMLHTIEYTLSCVDGYGLSIDEMLVSVQSVLSFVRGFAQSELAEVQAGRRTGMTEEQWRTTQGPYVQWIIESGRYPLFAKVITDAALPHMALDRQFQTGLEHVLDGIAAKLDRQG